MMRCATLLSGLLACLVAPARGEESCAPLTPASLRRTAERLALDVDQTRWLQDALATDRLRYPADLDGLPGAGPELRDVVAAALCWDRAPRGQTTVGVAARENFAERHGTFFWETTRVEVKARVRERSSEERPLIRGGVTLRGGSWSLAAGTLECRGGLGLALETAGTEPRGAAPREVSLGGFEAGWSTDPRIPVGAALGFRHAAWGLDMAVVRPAEDHSASGLGVLLLERRTRSTRLAGVAVASPEGLAASLTAAGRLERGAWAAEVAQGGSGQALGASGSVESGAWRARGSLTWRGTGYSNPLARGWERPRQDGVVSLAGEARWQSRPGRTLRIAWSEDREPSAGGFPRNTSMTEVEAGERFARGLELGFLWRGRRSVLPLDLEGEEAGQEARAELRFARRGFQGRIRLDERLDEARSRALHLKVGRARVPWEWEVRAVRVESDLEAPSNRVYFRRAGDLVGWTTAPPGTTVGAWVRGRRGAWTVEVSGDGGAGHWTWSVAVRRGLGGRLDPTGPSP